MRSVLMAMTVLAGLSLLPSILSQAQPPIPVAIDRKVWQQGKTETSNKLDRVLAEVSTAQNLLPNGSFEGVRRVGNFTLPRDWFAAHWYQPQEADTVPIQDDYITMRDAFSGKHALILKRADPKDANAGVVHSRQIKLQPLTLYTFSLVFSMRSIRGAGDVTVQFFDERNELLPDSVRLIFDANGLKSKEGLAVRGGVSVEKCGGGWLRLSVKFVVPRKALFTIVCLRLSHGSPAEGFVVIDDVRIEPEKRGMRKALPGFPLARALRTEHPPKIDGILNDEPWRVASRITDFVDLQTGKPSEIKTIVRLCYDDRALYIAFECLEPNMPQLKPAKRERDSLEIFSDECVEVFIDPEYSRTHYFHFAVNANGNLYDAEGFDQSWNSSAQVAASLGEGAWFVELAIPFECVAITPEVTGLWGLNLTRTRNIERRQHMCWSWTQTGFHRPDRFGALEIADVDWTRFVELRPRHLVASTDKYHLFAESSLVKVSANEWFDIPQTPQVDVHVYAAKGEWESFQLILRPHIDLKGVRVEVADLIGKASKLTAENVMVYREDYPNPTTAVPDVLKPVGNGFDCPANRNTCVWVDIWVPRDAHAGIYRGKLRIVPQNAPPAAVRMNVHVYDFALPERLRFRTGLFSIWGTSVARWFKVPIGHPTYEGVMELTPEYEAIMKRLYHFYVLNRISPGEPTPMTWRDLSIAKRKPFDPNFVKEFERWASYWLDNGLYLDNITRYGNPTCTEEEFYGFWYPYLKQRGWLKFAYTRGPNDECVDPKDERTQENITWGKLVGKIAPGFKRLQTVPTLNVEHLKAFVGACDIWCVTPEQHLRIPEIKGFLDQRMEQGEEVWWYIHEFLWGYRDKALRHRVFFWLAMRYGVNGCILWSTTCWSEDATYYPMIVMKRLPDGSGILAGPTADGILFYPGPNREVYQSLRIKMVRDGLEDVEYFLLLKDRLADAERKGDVQTAERIRQALKGLDRIALRYGDYTSDPDELLRIRRLWGEILSHLRPNRR
jgi:hypothetical protein